MKQKILKITEAQYNAFINGEDLITEINHLAVKSNVTVASLEDFKNIVSGLGINDGNVEHL